MPSSPSDQAAVCAAAHRTHEGMGTRPSSAWWYGALHAALGVLHAALRALHAALGALERVVLEELLVLVAEQQVRNDDLLADACEST
jgi:hypothetical protein